MEEARYIIRRHLRPWGWRYTWQLVAANSKAVCSSEPYTTKAHAEDGIEAHRRAAATAVIVDETA